MTRYLAGGAALEVVEELKTRRTIPPRCAPGCGLASPRLPSVTPEAWLPLLGPPLRPHLPWLLAGPPSSRQSAAGSVSMRPRGRTRSARRVRCGAHPRRLLERRGCSMCACCDRVSDGILGGDHVGDVQPSGAQLGARMSAQECSGVSDRFALGASILSWEV